jgi:hypothetical protein
MINHPNRSKRSTFAVGNQVYVKNAAKKSDYTMYEITRIFPNGFSCLIRQEGTAPNGKPYAEQRFDLSLLKHAVSDELLKNLSFGAFKAVRRTRKVARKSNLPNPWYDL